MLLAYQAIAVIVFICSFLGDYKRHSSSPSQVFGNLFGSAVVAVTWPLLIVIRILVTIYRACK